MYLIKTVDELISDLEHRRERARKEHENANDIVGPRRQKTAREAAYRALDAYSDALAMAKALKAHMDQSEGS
jgi:hypothetical protein